MNQLSQSTGTADRRGFLIRLIQGTYALIGATLAFVVGGINAAHAHCWLRAEAPTRPAQPREEGGG